MSALAPGVIITSSRPHSAAAGAEAEWDEGEPKTSKGEASAKAALPPAAAGSMRRLHVMWGALGTPRAEQEKWSLRCRAAFATAEGSAVLDAVDELDLVSREWSEAAEAVLGREEALLALGVFEGGARAPERLLERGPAPYGVDETPTPRPQSPASGWTGAITPVPAKPAAVAKAAGGGRPLTPRQQAAAGPQTSADAPAPKPKPKPASSTPSPRGPAQVRQGLLFEAKRRGALRSVLHTAETRLMAALTRVEVRGYTVWFQGVLYRDKMRSDEAKMLQNIDDDAARQAAVALKGSDPFAPPGALAPLSPRLAAAPPQQTPLRTQSGPLWPTKKSS
jgi:hypothetical protein